MKQEKNNKLIIILVCLGGFIILLIVCLLFGIYKMNSNNYIDTSDINSIYFVKDSLSEEGKKIVSARDVNNYSKKDILGSYKCVSPKEGELPCGEYLTYPNPKYYFVDKNSVIIYDGDNYYKYNYLTKTIEDIYSSVMENYALPNGDFVLAVKKDDGGKYAFLNKNGRLITGYDYDSVISWKNAEVDNKTRTYNFYGPKGYLTASKDNLWGVINLTNGKTVIDFKYSAINITYNGYFVVYDENRKYVVLDENGNQIMVTDYEIINCYDNFILVKNENNYYKLINYDNNELTESVKVDNFNSNNYKFELDEREIKFIAFNAPVQNYTFTYNLNEGTLDVSNFGN